LDFRFWISWGFDPSLLPHAGPNANSVRRTGHTTCCNRSMRLPDYAPRPAHSKWLLDSDPPSAERTKAGLRRAKAAGKLIGRPTLVVARQRISELRAGGISFTKIAKEFGCSPEFIHKTVQSTNGSPSALTTWLSAPDETQLPFGCKRNQAADPTDHLKGV